ncbi:hypothetical protein FQ087_06145 [Sporosarcina sp. ANT_H38]|uniref:hypothetical protein n=1 Tax=Sporosarcina sp. ANT_H38 TaxID=2597358 RepID=UPI0011F2C471|nr:hypothetical protein [Sporosarcina sp. ANT_H38]KAA0965845.1 hypothetical protein FQ087_06145 [Sporosarcina sp. ANT_H38]
MSKSITIKNEGLSKCPECKGEDKLIYQQEWDRLFEYYDKSTQAHDLVVNRIYNDDKQPKYICADCSLKILVTA